MVIHAPFEAIRVSAQISRIRTTGRFRPMNPPQIAPHYANVLNQQKGPMKDLTQLSPAALLALHAKISEELRKRGITRSSNNPVGDLAEHLFCKAFGWDQASNSNANLDAIGPDGKTYQIKGRRITHHNNSRQLSAIRELKGKNFDFLAGVLFEEDYSILRAAIIPHAIVMANSTYVERTNSHRFLLRDEIWEEHGVKDVTNQLRSITL